MKRVYWRPPGVSRTALVLIAFVAVSVATALEHFPVVRKQRDYAAKIAAARLAREGQEAIKAEKQRLGHMPSPEVDPARTGMLGESITPVTSNTGFINAKRTSTNPNFAAVIVHLLREADVEEGDLVAVGVSGSFPALNLATYAALHTLGSEAIIIASASSSEWGANHVDYLWLDMERTLRDKELIPFKVAAASYGGIDDLGLGLTSQGRSILDAAMDRNGVRRLQPASLSEGIALREALFDELAGDRKIKAYVNVGGGSASVGTHVGKKQFKAGLNREPPLAANVPDSVMLRFANRDIPVIHISRVKLLTQRFGLPYGQTARIPVGEGNVYVKSEYNRWIAGGGLVLILAVMMAFLRWSVGARLLEGLRPRRETKEDPGQMV